MSKNYIDNSAVLALRRKGSPSLFEVFDAAAAAVNVAAVRGGVTAVAAVVFAPTPAFVVRQFDGRFIVVRGRSSSPVLGRPPDQEIVVPCGREAVDVVVKVLKSLQ